MSYLCEYEFNQPDSENPNFSQMEFDLWIEHKEGYRYSLRKNLKTNNWEFYRHYYERYNRKEFDEVQYTYSSFSQTLIALNRELKNRHHSDHNYQECTHHLESLCFKPKGN